MQNPRKWRKPALPERASSGVAFVALTDAALEQIRANSAGAALGRDPEYLHQLRVGVRRLRSALSAFRALLRRRRAARVETPWRAMMPALGEARDWDVFLASLPAGALREQAATRRTEMQTEVRALVRSKGFREACTATRAVIHRGLWRRRADPVEPLAPFARRALNRLHESLCASAAGIDWRDAGLRHRVRIRVKRMRYGCDFFSSAFRYRHANAFLEGLRKLQDVLGEMNDIAVQRFLLRRLVPRGSPLKVVEAQAEVRARMAQRERELIAALEPAWAAFEARRPFWQRRAVARATA